MTPRTRCSLVDQAAPHIRRISVLAKDCREACANARSDNFFATVDVHGATPTATQVQRRNVNGTAQTRQTLTKSNAATNWQLAAVANGAAVKQTYQRYSAFSKKVS